MFNKYKNLNMKKFEIWTGSYNLGQGYHGGERPEKSGEEIAVNFTIACMKYELRRRLKFIEMLEERGDNPKSIISIGLKFDLDLETLRQSWIGGYYESEEEALKTFNRS
jgi:hypothetical protein